MLNHFSHAVLCSNKDAVTEELVELVYRPSCDKNAREVFVSVVTGERTIVTNSLHVASVEQASIVARLD
jgi:hypothetical protein